MSRKNKKIDGEEHEEKEPTEKSKYFNVLNRQNAPQEIFINKELIRFDAHGKNPVYPKRYADGVPADVVEHKDFQSVSKYFVVTEIK